MNLRLTLEIQNTKRGPNFYEEECTTGNIYLLNVLSQVPTWKLAETADAINIYWCSSLLITGIMLSKEINYYVM